MRIKEYLESIKEENDKTLTKIRKILTNKWKEVEKVEPAHGVSQYVGLKWIKCIFKDDVKMKSEYKDVEGFHLMPYRIRKADFENAVISGSVGKFIEQETDFSDFDINTGNIHICPNGAWQIVLIVNTGTESKPKLSGPGWRKIICNSDSFKVEYEVKTNYYFPRIDSNDEDIEVNNEKYDDLLKLINDVIKEITE